MKIPEQLQTAYRAAKKAGWDFQWLGDGHLLWTSPAGKTVSTAGTRIGSHRTVRNYEAELRRAGLAFGRQPKKRHRVAV